MTECNKLYMIVNRTTCAEFRWQKPYVGWVKANSDGVVRGSDSLVAAEGVIRDAQGGWIYGCTRRIGRCSNLVADRVIALCCDSLSESMVFDYVPAALVELVRKEAVDT
ncbi:hypothetical protein V6N11_012716 [Hibiscus sabdariffa]|uniref:Uncharacterized protein n=2 Tax=Hibiscus sabdariffa TaxID=183260 RepID=A0ABR2G1B0_9ROSI